MSENYKARLGKEPGTPSSFLVAEQPLEGEGSAGARKLHDTFVALEYEVPYNQSRLDCLLFSKGKNDISNVVLIELKQWSSVKSLTEEAILLRLTPGEGKDCPPPFAAG
ncbi:MAG: hypothetical protein IPJ16_05720 [Bacteroidales bacterium]|nr:hypothetical protein [Bacteroidales bacterium]